jgi:hypothetical protein
MNGVEPSGPRALRSLGSSATDFMNPCRSPACNASTMATALEFNGGSSASLASESGQSAPWSYPCFNDVDLFRTERPGGGHLHAIRVPRYPVIQKAVVTAAGHYATATDDRAFPVEPQSTGLLRGPMTAHTVLPQDWQHILCEIDFSRGLGRQYPRKYQRKERRPRKSRSPHTPLLKKRNPKERHHRLAGRIAPPRHFAGWFTSGYPESRFLNLPGWSILHHSRPS